MGRAIGCEVEETGGAGRGAPGCRGSGCVAVGDGADGRAIGCDGDGVVGRGIGCVVAEGDAGIVGREIGCVGAVDDAGIVGRGIGCVGAVGEAGIVGRGIGCVGAAVGDCARGNGPDIEATGTSPRAAAEPGTIGMGRVTCEGAGMGPVGWRGTGPVGWRGTGPVDEPG